MKVKVFGIIGATWLSLLLLIVALVPPLAAQTAVAVPAPSATPPGPQTPTKVDVEPAAADPEIADRLQRILKATDWFTSPEVKVDEGVVFLRGSTGNADYKEWAGTLAAKTQDVVAVVNQISVTERGAWDFSPAETEVRKMVRNVIQSLPMLALAGVLLALTILAAAGSSRLTDYVLHRRMPNVLLRQVAVRAAMIPVALIGIYLVLRISGLTQIAVTVLGGTGLVGLIIGIAFQNIAENFLASILISMQRPFEAGDLVEVAGFQGYVQRVTTRGTVLLTLDGNHVQVPNSIIYKSIIRNLSANPNSRLDFRVGLGYDQATSKAQSVAMQVLNDHPAVLKDPDPSVLVEELADAKVYLRIYFWVNIKEHSSLKVRSAIMRLIKKAFHDADLSISQEASAAVAAQVQAPARHGQPEVRPATESGRVSVQAEGRLTSEKSDIQHQANKSRQVEQGPDLLGHANGKA